MGLKSWAKNIGTGYVTGSILRAMGEGKSPILPNQAQWIYWHTDGLATNSGIVLAAVAGIIEVADRSGLCNLLGFDCHGWIETAKHVTASVGAFFIYIGQVRGSLHLSPPEVPLKFWDQAARVSR